MDLAYLMGPAGFCVAAYASGWLAERGFGREIFKASLVKVGLGAVLAVLIARSPLRLRG